MKNPDSKNLNFPCDLQPKKKEKKCQRNKFKQSNFFFESDFFLQKGLAITGNKKPETDTENFFFGGGENTKHRLTFKKFFLLYYWWIIYCFMTTTTMMMILLFYSLFSSALQPEMTSKSGIQMFVRKKKKKLFNLFEILIGFYKSRCRFESQQRQPFVYRVIFHYYYYFTLRPPYFFLKTTC